MAEARKEITLVIPVFRGGNILFKLYEKIISALHPAYDIEILFICDGCDTLSAEVVRKIKKTDPDRVNHYFLKKNYGQHIAIRFGLGLVQGDFAVTMDEDLQHAPEDIPKLILKQSEGNFDLVYGSFAEPEYKVLRYRLSRILRKVLVAFIPGLYDKYSPYRLIRRDICHQASDMVSPFIFIDDFLCKAAQKITHVEIDHHKRLEGASSYNIAKVLALGLFLSLTYLGVTRLLTRTGIILILIGVVDRKSVV